MSYIGNPLTQGFDYINKQTFTGDGVTTSFTMSDPVGKEEIIEVFVAGVRQEPVVAYTTNGYNLNFTGAPGLGDTIYVVNNNSPIRLNEPPLDSIATANLKDGAVTQAKIDASVSLGGSVFKGNNGTVGNSLGDIFRVNTTTLSTNTSINTTENASAAGPITIAASTVLTVNGHLSIL